MSRRTEPATMTVTTDVQPYRIGIADPRIWTEERDQEMWHSLQGVLDL